jgi:ribonuclease D
MEENKNSEKDKTEKEPRFFIEKEKIMDLPVGAFRGIIRTLTRESQQESVDKAIHVLGTSRILGFDTESKPSYKKGEINPIALIQLSTQHKAFLFRTADGWMPEGLKRVMENPRILKIGQGLKHEMRTLKKELKVDGRGFIDMLDIAHKLDCVPKSVRGLSAIFLRFRIIKSAQRTNWERHTLTEKQKLYAATDAWAPLMIYDEMRRRGLLDPRWKMAHK